MREIVEFFIADLSERVKAIEAAHDACDRARLRTLAHQLKGAAGGYGFPSIGTAAAALEGELRQETSGLEEIRAKVEALLKLCVSAIPAGN